jgi:hypothetical protein
MLVAGCASSGGTTQAPSSAAAGSSQAGRSTSSVCTGAAAVRTSLKELEQVKVSKGSGAVLAADLRNVETSLKTLGSEASKQWSTQISGVQAALSQLHSAVTALSSQPSVSAVAAVASAMAAVKTAGTALTTRLQAKCPNSGN